MLLSAILGFGLVALGLGFRSSPYHGIGKFSPFRSILSRLRALRYLRFLLTGHWTRNVVRLLPIWAAICSRFPLSLGKNFFADFWPRSLISFGDSVADRCGEVSPLRNL